MLGHARTAGRTCDQRGRRTAKRVAGVVTAAVAVLGAGLTGCGEPEVARLELGSCGVDGPDHPERCALLQVPVDWADPDGEQMELQVLVVPAWSDDPAPDPLFHLAGFGGSSLGDAEWAYRTFVSLEDRHDLVFVGQRGTGATAETCSLPPENEADADVIRAAVADCLASLRRDPRHDTTASAVRDLEAARVALGYDTVNLYGGSYGVTLGLAYLQAHPDRVRTAVLDSGSMLDVRLWQLVPAHAQEALDALVRDCAAAPACADAYDPAADLATLVDRLTTAPERADLGDGQTVTIDVTGLTSALVDVYLARPETAVLLPQDLQAMVRGEWAEVIRSRGLLPPGGPDVAPTQVQTLTVRCSDEWAQMDPAAVAAQTQSLFTATTLARARWQEALCAAWPHDEGVGGPVEASAPVVFLNGTRDPADPPQNVASASRTMTGSLAVAVPGAAHGALEVDCILQEVTAFIEAGDAPDPAAWAGCTDTLRDVLPVFPTG